MISSLAREHNLLTLFKLAIYMKHGMLNNMLQNDTANEV